MLRHTLFEYDIPVKGYSYRIILFIFQHRPWVHSKPDRGCVFWRYQIPGPFATPPINTGSGEPRREFRNNWLNETVERNVCVDRLSYRASPRNPVSTNVSPVFSERHLDIYDIYVYFNMIYRSYLIIHNTGLSRFPQKPLRYHYGTITDFTRNGPVMVA